jgi:NAD(P)H-hydrate epimerase
LDGYSSGVILTGENVKLVTSAAMREVDRVTISEFGLPGVVLMEHAGQAVARLALELLVGPKQCQHVLILCGTGNNGGDGFVVARVLANLGFPVTVALFGKPEALKGDAATF